MYGQSEILPSRDAGCLADVSTIEWTETLAVRTYDLPPVEVSPRDRAQSETGVLRCGARVRLGDWRTHMAVGAFVGGHDADREAGDG